MPQSADNRFYIFKQKKLQYLYDVFALLNVLLSFNLHSVTENSLNVICL